MGNKQNAPTGFQMLKSISTIIARSPATFLSDALGASALVVILMVGLNLPLYS
ncbi:MAG: hypothetical protein ACWA47_13490 [Brevirhabdus sp.]